jgi:hypothetical protein
LNAFIKLPAIAVGTIAACAVLGVVALAAINLQDEVLSPGAIARLTPDPVRTDPAVNGIFATVGLGAEDPVAYGRRWAEAATVRDASASPRSSCPRSRSARSWTAGGVSGATSPTRRRRARSPPPDARSPRSIAGCGTTPSSRRSR